MKRRTFVAAGLAALATASFRSRRALGAAAGADIDADPDTVERNREWARSSFARLEPLTHGRYVNITSGDDHDSHLSAAYGDNYPRLAALKKQYDPGNLFRLNANIKPA